VWGACQNDEANSIADAPTPTTTAPAPSTCRADSAPIVLRGRLSDSIDGDSFYVSGVEVRLAVVDTPERAEPGYEEASSFTDHWFGAEDIAVYRPTSAPSHDRYERLVGEVVRTRDCASLNVDLVRSGNAEILDRYCSEDPDLCARLHAA
jgi:endonuclease YncB( thermonuclease family)